MRALPWEAKVLAGAGLLVGCVILLLVWNGMSEFTDSLCSQNGQYQLTLVKVSLVLLLLVLAFGILLGGYVIYRRTQAQSYVFVCYKSDEIELVRPHVHFLQGHGVRVVWDQAADRPYGMKWTDWATEVIPTVRVGLVFVSHACLASEECRMEIRQLRETPHPLGARRRIIPVFLEAGKDLRLAFPEFGVDLVPEGAVRDFRILAAVHKAVSHH